MTHISVDVPPLAHVRSPSGSEPVGPISLNRRTLRAGTAIASAIRGALAFAPAQAFVAPPVDGLPPSALPDADRPLSLVEKLRQRLRPEPEPEREPRRDRPPRLMPTDAGRHVNAMPGHAMAAGGRPMIIRIPGK